MKERRHFELAKLIEMDQGTLKVRRSKWYRTVGVYERLEAVDGPVFVRVKSILQGEFREFEIGKGYYRIVFEYDHPSLEEYKRLLEQLNIQFFNAVE